MMITAQYPKVVLRKDENLKLHNMYLSRVFSTTQSAVFENKERASVSERERERERGRERERD